MLTTILFSQALLLACAVQGVIAAPQHGSLSSGTCYRPDPSTTNVLLSFTARFRCKSGASYTRKMIETASLEYDDPNSTLMVFEELKSCQNVEKFTKSAFGDQFLAEHHFGPFHWSVSRLHTQIALSDLLSPLPDSLRRLECIC
ncbi:hypothetical protein IWX91DRAFT_320623 [Phyllosticta citricarpa]